MPVCGLRKYLFPAVLFFGPARRRPDPALPVKDVLFLLIINLQKEDHFS